MSWIENMSSASLNQAAGICLCAYLLGCFTAGYYLVRVMAGRDIRDIGSGSVGARNVSRVLGRKGFLLTVLFDFGKGAFVIWGARHFTADTRLVALAMLAVVVGHVWPMPLRFRGGKGMATILGALLVYDPKLAFVFAIVFVCLLAGLRKTTLPGLFALTCVPIASLLLSQTPAKVVLLSITAGVVLLAHRKNLHEEFSQLARRHADQPQTGHTRL